MRDLSAAELLEVWERGRGADPVRRALLLLGAAEPHTPADELAALSIGRRDARLLRLRECVFGGRLEAVTSCATCGERLELAFGVGELLRSVDAEPGPEEAPPLELEAAGYHVRFRLPTSADLVAVAEAGATAPVALLERCVEEVEGTEAELPPELADALASRMAEADPGADLELALTCPACAGRWTAPFDIVAYFWAEIEVWARRTLREVHRLASAYGWSEPAILALSPQRRQAYLELLGT
jgi:hypothetical protein